MRFVCTAAFLCIAANSFAYTTGVSGYSGKDMQTCTACHAPAAAKPSATLSGPGSLAAGGTGTYQLVIDTDVNSAASVKRQAGFDVATSGGALGTLDQTNPTRLIAGELSHTNALPQAKTVAVSFTLTAPQEGGTVTLFAAALSADGDGTNKGDSTATTTLDVQVIAPAAPDDLAGVDQLGVDLAESAPPPDLSQAVDAISSATAATPMVSHDLGPPRDELRWSCGSYVGVPFPVAGSPVLVIGLFALILRRRRS